MNRKQTEEAVERLRELCWDKGYKQYNFRLSNGTKDFIQSGFNLAPDTIEIWADVGAYDMESYFIWIVSKKQNLDIYIYLDEGADFEAQWQGRFFDLKQKSTGNEYHFVFH